jgi:iron complex transport system ATP-binding protein
MSCVTRGAGLAVLGLGWAPRRRDSLIREISFSIEPGDRLVIVGPNGAGKSTLLRLLYRSIKPKAGSVFLDGQDIWTLSPASVARSVAVVLQETPANFPFSVRDIVLMGRIPWRKGFSRWSDADHQHAAHALGHLGLEGLEDRKVSTLSGGEKQRVLVARALAQSPRLLILDEPSNHLDIRHQLEVIERIKALGITIITTLHDINLAADFATKAAIIDHGRFVAFGEPRDVFTETHISQVFGVQATGHAGGRGKQARFTFSLSQTGATA